MEPNDQQNRHPEDPKAEGEVLVLYEAAKGTETEPETAEREPEPNGETPAPLDLWKRLSELPIRIKLLTVLNVTVAVGAIAQACFAYHSNQLTREALAQNERHYQGILAQAQKLNDDTLRKTESLTRDSLAESRKANEAAQRAARAAEVQTALGKQSLDASQEAYRAEQRARLAFTMMPFERIDSVRGAISFRMPLDNFGKTEAFNVRYRARAIAMRTDANIVPAEHFANTPWIELPAILPNETNREMIGFGNKTSFAKYLQEGLGMFLIAELRYCDAFKRPHKKYRDATTS